jgi:hypothetical protein
MGAGAAFGFVNGAMTRDGVILTSFLMAAGAQGASLIATDTIIWAIWACSRSRSSAALTDSTSR